MLTERQQQILGIIRREPMVAQQELADRLGISRSAVAGHVMALVESGAIRGRGYLVSEPRYVCVVGGANVDIEGRTSAHLALHDSNPGTVRRSPGGVGRNVAENLARLGVPTRLVTALGDDADGRWLHDQTDAAGVDLADTLVSSDVATATYLSVLDHRGELHVAVNDMAALTRLDPDALAARSDTISNAAALVLDCNLEPVSLAHLLGATGGPPVFVDTVSTAKAERIRPHLPSVHLLKPNRAEAALLSGVATTGTRSLRRAAAALLDAGVSRVVISLGSDGVFHADREGWGTITPPPSTVASATGAGDALLAALVHAHLADLPLAEAARFAVAAASLAASTHRSVAEQLSVAAVTRRMQEQPT